MADFTFRADIDLSAAETRAKSFEKIIDRLGQQLTRGLKLDIDATKSVNTLKTTANLFDKNKNKALENLAAQQKALAAMVVSGKGGTDAYQKQERAIEEATREVKKYEAALRKADKVSLSAGSGATGLRGKLSGFTDSLSGLSSAVPQLSGLSTGLSSISSVGLKTGGILAGVGVAVAGLTKAVSLGVEFNDKMTQSLAIQGAVSDDTRKQMEEVAKTVGKDFNLGAASAAESYFFLASAGLSAEQQIAALPQVAAFAKAGMFDMALATDLATDAQSALGLASKDPQKNLENLTRVTDVFVKANTLANTSVEQVSKAITNKFGASLRSVGKDVEEGTALLAAYADQGIKGELAGTAASIVTRDLQTAALKNAGAFKSLGVTVFDSNGEMRAYADIVQDLEGLLDGMSDAQKKTTLAQLGFQDKSQSFLLTLLGTSDSIRRYDTELRKAGGTTQEVADKQMQSLSERWKSLTGTLEAFALKIFDSLEPALSGAIDLFGFLLSAVSPVIDIIGFLITSVISIVKWVGNAATSFGKFLANLGPVRSVVEAVSGAFVSTVTYLTKLYEKVKGPALQAFTAFTAKVKEIKDSVLDKLTSALRSVGTFLSNGWAVAWRIASTPIRAASSVITTVWGWLGKLYDAIASGIRWIYNFGGRFSWLRNQIGGVIDFVTGLYNKIRDFIGIIGDFLSIGGDDVDVKVTAKVTAEAEPGNVAEVGEELGEELGDGFAEGADKSKSKAKKEIVDFAEEVAKALKEVRDSKANAEIEATTDELARLDLENANRLRKLEEGYQEELQALQKKIDEANKKKAEAAEDNQVINVEIQNLRAAQDAIQEKRIQLQAEGDAEYARKRREALVKLYDSERKLSEEAIKATVDAQKRLLEAQKETVDTSTIEGLKEATEKELGLLTLAYNQTAQEIAATAPEFKAALQRIQAEVESEAITPAEGAAKAQEALNAQIVKDQADTNTLLFAEYQAYLKKKERAAADAAKKIADIERDALLKGSALLRLALSLREANWKSHFDKLAEMRRNAAKEEKEIDEKSLESLRDRLSRGVIDRDQFVDELKELNEAARASAGEQYGFWDATFAGVKDSLTAFSEQASEIFKSKTDEFAELQADSEKKISDVWRKSKELIGPLVQDMSAQIASLAANTKGTLKDFARDSLIIFLDATRRFVSVAIAQIIAKSFAESPILGAIIAGLAVTAVNVGLGAASAAVAGFRKGGFTGFGRPDESAGVVHKGEFVFNAPTTQKHRAFFESVHKGTDPLTAALKLYGSTEKSKSGVLVDRQLLERVRSVEAGQGAISRAVADMAKTFTLAQPIINVQPIVQGLNQREVLERMIQVQSSAIIEKHSETLRETVSKIYSSANTSTTEKFRDMPKLRTEPESLRKMRVQVATDPGLIKEVQAMRTEARVSREALQGMSKEVQGMRADFEHRTSVSVTGSSTVSGRDMAFVYEQAKRGGTKGR